VSQIWFKKGTAMIAVHYGGGDDGEEFCNMNASSDGGLVEFDFTQEYTAECFHGYADIGVYLLLEFRWLLCQRMRVLFGNQYALRWTLSDFALCFVM
jgi:hypothetical protein